MTSKYVSRHISSAGKISIGLQLGWRPEIFPLAGVW
jgi:hypothetical protein